MTFYRGQDGFMALGGKLSGTPVSNGAVTATSTSFTIHVTSGHLYGIVAAGDKFTVAGETGSPVHTVVAGASPFYVATDPTVGPITFTPPAASGGWADGAAVTFQSNSIAQVVGWTLQTQQDLLDGDIMGISWKQYVGGLGSWTGNMTVRLDYGDPQQKILIDDIYQSTPTATIVAINFGVTLTGTPSQAAHFFYGGAVLRNLQIQNQLTQLATMTCDFTGTGSPAIQWTP